MLTAGSRTFDHVDDLEKLVVHAATEYDIRGFVEDLDGVEVTDPEYDDLIRTLRKHKPQSAALVGTSPSQAKPKGSTIVHNPPMTSISKADGTEDEKKAIYEKWLQDCATRLGTTVDKLSVAQSYKRDGVALRVNYEKGKLVSAGQRPRDGVNGSDVTRHMKYIAGVPQKLPLPLTLSLNGEIECWFKDFDKVNADQDAAGEDAYKNPRNFTAGCLGRDDPEENKNSRLRVAFYSITGFDEWADYYKTEVERAKWANSEEGLNLCDEKGKGYFVQVRSHKFEHLKVMEDFAKQLPYYTDGVVLKINDLEAQEELGHSGDDLVNDPRGALAWKYEEETADAEVSSIEWNASRTGRIVPTAIFNKPFKLADTENTRATCNNLGWMEKQGLGMGAYVRCKKGGKIIPNIMAVLTPVKDTGAPVNCPTCNSKLVEQTSSSGNKDLLCKNRDCGAKHSKSWVFYVQGIGGKGLGLAAMEQILHTGKVKCLADLYDLTVQDLTAGGFSEREALLALATIYVVKPHDDNAKLLASIEKARAGKQKIEAWKFFAALGIPGAGNSAGKALIQHYKSFDAIGNATVEELRGVDGIGDITAQAIVDWFAHYGDVVDRLLLHMDLQLPKTGKLSGKNFVLTGSFTQGKKYWEEKIEAIGGNISSSVGSSTNYLVQELGKNDGSPSEKEKKANALGVPVISVPDLEKML